MKSASENGFSGAITKFSGENRVFTLVEGSLCDNKKIPDADIAKEFSERRGE
jgi:hypothetical protein